MKVEKMTKKEIISKILYYDSRFMNYLSILHRLKKSVLLNVYTIVLLNFTSSKICDFVYINLKGLLV